MVGFGLAGIEQERSKYRDAFRDAFRAATAAGLRSLPHAGEMSGPETIWEALDHLGAERIGHGIACVEDPRLVAHLRETQIPLEVCPTSNVCTGQVARIEEHPLPRMIEEGLVVTLNSDDPPMFATTLSGEYRVAADLLGLDRQILTTLARNAVDASCLDPAGKQEILAEIDEIATAFDALTRHRSATGAPKTGGGARRLVRPPCEGRGVRGRRSGPGRRGSWRRRRGPAGTGCAGGRGAGRRDLHGARVRQRQPYGSGLLLAGGDHPHLAGALDDRQRQRDPGGRRLRRAVHRHHRARVVQGGHAGEQRGHVAVRAHAEHQDVERRRRAVVLGARGPAELLGVRLGRLLGGHARVGAAHHVHPRRGRRRRGPAGPCGRRSRCARRRRPAGNARRPTRCPPCASRRRLWPGRRRSRRGWRCRRCRRSGPAGPSPWPTGRRRRG